MKNITKRSATILGFVALICIGISMIIYQLTKSQIANQIAMQQQTLLHEVVPHDMYTNDLLKSCYIPNQKKYPLISQLYVAKKDGKITAYVMQAIAPNGYSGNIIILVATTPAGEVLGVRVVQQNETPGLGDKIELAISDWVLSFKNKIVDHKDLKMWAVKKDGGTFDQFSGATITPRAVVGSVKNSVLTAIQDFSNVDVETWPHCK